VLAELDKHKVAHKNQRVRKTTESLIGRMKEYRRRGRLTDGDGVTLVRDVSRFVALAVEPDLENSLPWLDARNNDDRILASFVEVMRRYPRSPVILVTRDFNLQNKAEFARLSFVEPPDKPRPKARKDVVSGEVEHKRQ
jgi:predicted ribonuclease YlaK